MEELGKGTILYVIGFLGLNSEIAVVVELKRDHYHKAEMRKEISNGQAMYEKILNCIQH